MGIFTKKKNESPNLGGNLNHDIHIKQITINSRRDFIVLRHHLLEGDIMVCNLRPLIKIVKNNNQSNELHNHLQQIKHYCLQYGGMVSKLEESLLLVTPNSNIIVK